MGGDCHGGSDNGRTDLGGQVAKLRYNGPEEAVEIVNLEHGVQLTFNKNQTHDVPAAVRDELMKREDESWTDGGTSKKED
jgi:hypothetical protein